MNSEPTITMNNLQIVGGYEFEQEICQLCRGSLVGPQLQDLTNENKTNIEMKVVVGKCDHIFHRKCLHELKKSGFLSCPVSTCKVTWEEKAECNCDLGFY